MKKQDKKQIKSKNKMAKKSKPLKFNTGAVIKKPGSSKENKTGGWRSFRPVWDKEKCKQCMLCWMFCPDNAIPLKNGKRIETDFNHCKGCGICKEVCPFNAIKMVKEKK